MIINDSYFKGDIYLAQVAQESRSGLVNNAVNLTYFIDKYERRILEKGLGQVLTGGLYSSVDTNGKILDSAVGTRFDRLLNGESYTKDGIDFLWKGLVVKEGLLNRSMMAYYVYFKYVTENGEAHTETNPGKSRNVVNAYRSFLEWYGEVNCYYEPSIYHRNGFLVEDYFNGQDNSDVVSLYKYMTDHKEDFPEWKFTRMENINRFDI